MSAGCENHDEGLTLLAADALEPQEEARVRSHLETCAACRSDLEARREVLGLCAPSPVSSREQAVVEALPRTTLGAWRRSQVRQASRLRTTAALLVAAAGVLLMLGPVVQRPGTPLPPAPLSESPALASDEEALELEQWAQADPLTDALEPADLDLEDTGAPFDTSDLESEDFLPFSPGGIP